jgi:cytosine/adenosine deaminase-related metal-dependent hydrolase
MPAMEALALATIEGARVLGLDDRVGSLEPGKRADLAVVRIDETHALPGGDPVARVVYACTANDVRHVVIDGRIVVKGGELATLDEERVQAEAKREAKRVIERAF